MTDWPLIDAEFQIASWHQKFSVIDFEDQDVWESVFHEGKWAGVFQFTQHGAQKFCKAAKPRSLVDLAAITAIYRPGPLSANVHDLYVTAKSAPDEIEYIHPIVKECLEDTYGFIVFQEQLALLAHKLGRRVSLDEGNMLRKLLTKKGTGKGAKDLERIRKKFIAGCEDKGIRVEDADDLWRKMEFFSGYGFNASHAISYAAFCLQKTWLATTRQSGWQHSSTKSLKVAKRQPSTSQRASDTKSSLSTSTPLAKSGSSTKTAQL